MEEERYQVLYWPVCKWQVSNLSPPAPIPCLRPCNRAEQVDSHVCDVRCPDCSCAVCDTGNSEQAMKWVAFFTLDVVCGCQPASWCAERECSRKR